MNCTPSAFYPLLDAAGVDDYRALTSLQHVVLGGEPIARPRLARWLVSPNCRARVMNSYGPTECADVSASHWLEPHPDDPGRPIPIGRPINRAGMVVLDRSLHPVPFGVVGELCISGTPLGRGYVEDPRTTADRFVPNPFSTQGGERLYRTGDLAKYTDDGTLELVGRVDRQIKVRGFRIEPAEIESILQDHDNVRWAHVAMSSPTPASGTGQLHAYVLLEDKSEHYGTELRSFLRVRVPEYMVPPVFIRLETLPLTANGKVDHAALAALRPAPEPGAPRFVAPRQGMEQLVAEHWCGVLDIPQIGRDENLFEAGGDSLLLLQGHGRLENTLGRRIALVDLFSHPTVAAMGRYLEQGQTEATLEPVADGFSPAMERRRARRLLTRERRTETLHRGDEA